MYGLPIRGVPEEGGKVVGFPVVSFPGRVLHEERVPSTAGGACSLVVFQIRFKK